MLPHLLALSLSSRAGNDLFPSAPHRLRGSWVGRLRVSDTSDTRRPFATSCFAQDSSYSLRPRSPPCCPLSLATSRTAQSSLEFCLVVLAWGPCSALCSCTFRALPTLCPAMFIAGSAWIM